VDSEKKNLLIQTSGRAARNVNGQVIMYADKITDSIEAAKNEADFRRKMQKEYNKKNNITPQTVIKNISEGITSSDMDYADIPIEDEKKYDRFKNIKDIPALINKLYIKMFKLAQKLNFEEAAKIRDEIEELKKYHLASS